MAKAPSGFVPLSMNYMRDPAIRKAGPDAELLFIRSLAYCKSAQHDGEVPEYDLPVVGVGLKNLPQRVAALVREGLWLETDGGWLIKSWSKWNMTQSEIAEDRNRKREAAIRTNHDRWHTDGKTDPHCPHCREVQ